MLFEERLIQELQIFEAFLAVYYGIITVYFELRENVGRIHTLHSFDDGVASTKSKSNSPSLLLLVLSV